MQQMLPNLTNGALACHLQHLTSVSKYRRPTARTVLASGNTADCGRQLKYPASTTCKASRSTGHNFRGYGPWAHMTDTTYHSP